MRLNIIYHFPLHFYKMFTWGNIYKNMSRTWWNVEDRKTDEQCSLMNNSVEGTPALWSSAKARNLVILQWELIVVSNFFVNSYRLFTVDYNLLLAFNRDHFCVTIRLKETEKQIGNHNEMYIRSHSNNSLAPNSKINWIRKIGSLATGHIEF